MFAEPGFDASFGNPRNFSQEIDTGQQHVNVAGVEHPGSLLCRHKDFFERVCQALGGGHADNPRSPFQGVGCSHQRFDGGRELPDCSSARMPSLSIAVWLSASVRNSS